MKQQRTSLQTLWSVGIILCVVLSIFALGFSACTKPAETPEETGTDGFVIEAAPTEAAHSTEPPVTETTPELEVTAAPEVTARLPETEDAGRGYLERITFLGDSTTYGIGVYYNYGFTELCPPEQVWTPKSGTLTLSYYGIATIVYPPTKEELPIVDAVRDAKPDIMLITLGVNGISFMDEEWFIRDYTALVENIKEASPDTKLILNSIYPVAKSYEHQADINNDRIRAANVWIEQIAENTGCRFLNSFECLVDAEGFLPETYHNGDGLHLNGESFGLVMQYIRTHAYE